MRSMDCAWYAPDSTLKVTAVSTSADDAELAAGAELAADAEVAEDAVDDWHPTRKLMAISNAEKPMHIHLLSEIARQLKTMNKLKALELKGRIDLGITPEMVDDVVED